MNTPSSHRDRTLGLWLGVLGVAIFAVTLPATRLATGTSEQPQLSPWFVTVGRAALAGLLSAVFLLATRSPRPQPQQWRHLGWAVLAMRWATRCCWRLRCAASRPATRPW